MRGRHPAHRFHHGVGPDPEDSRPLGRTARAAADLAGSRAAHRLGRARAGALSTATSSSHCLTSCPRSISTASDRGRTRGHDKAPRPPDSERLRADARKTPLPGAMAADPVSRFPGRDRAGRRERAAHPSGDARGSAIDRTILAPFHRWRPCGNDLDRHRFSSGNDHRHREPTGQVDWLVTTKEAILERLWGWSPFGATWRFDSQ